jgi:hypothetical protein
VTRATLEAALAARNTPLDKRAVASASPPPLAEPEVVHTVAVAERRRPVSGPFTFALNAGAPKQLNVRASKAAEPPDVVGLSVRDAVRALHAAGFRVRLQGSGTISAATMRNGMVVLTAGEQSL